MNSIYSNMDYETKLGDVMFDNVGGDKTANNSGFYNTTSEQWLDNVNGMKFQSKLPPIVDILLSVYMIIVGKFFNMLSLIYLLVKV